MTEFSTQSILVIGIGNSMRGDDAAGLEIARKISSRGHGVITVKEESGEAAGLFEAWGGWDSVILLDAVCSGAKPGTIFQLDLIKDAVPRDWTNYSTHSMGLAESLELARALGELPEQVSFIGIEGVNFEIGQDLSSKVREALDRAVDRVLEIAGIPENTGFASPILESKGKD